MDPRRKFIILADAVTVDAPGAPVGGRQATSFA
jgi:hypothetical protein